MNANSTTTTGALTGALAVPAGACDCHIHVIPDPTRYPFTPNRSYTPPIAPLEALQAMHRRIGVERFVIVTPSLYGTDNSVTQDVLRQCPQQARGVAVIDEQTSDAELQVLHEAGVRGVRINREVVRQTDPGVFLEKLDATARRIAPLGWHIQANIRLSVIDSVKDHLAGLPVAVVIDHFGHLHADAGLQQPGMQALLDLLAGGRAYVKLSAVYQGSREAGYGDMAPFAQACIAASPQRVLWGSNWPHPDLRQTAHTPISTVTPYRVVDDVAVFDLLASWTQDPQVLRALLVDNPARVYDF